MGKVIEIESEVQFDEIILNNNCVVVDFNATWCEPCQKVKPDFESLADEYTKDGTVFCSVDIDDCQDIAEKCDVAKLPTFLVYKDQENCDEFIGGNSDGMTEMIKKHVT